MKKELKIKINLIEKKEEGETMKFIAKSKTVWGTIISLLPTLLPLFGVNFGVDETQLISNIYDALVTATGGLIALWGRFTADTKLTFNLKKD